MIYLKAERTSDSGAKPVFVALPIPVQEELIGTKNNNNRIFQTSNQFISGTTKVYLNGLKEGYYVESDVNEITLEEPPHSTDVLTIEYFIDI